MEVYLASSARNVLWAAAREKLLALGHKVHDWSTGPSAFTWAQVGVGDVDNTTADEMADAAGHADLRAGMAADMAALAHADVFVLMLPCGADAHFEAGVAFAMGTPIVVLCPTSFRASMFYGTARWFVDDVESMGEVLAEMAGEQEEAAE